MRPKKNLKVSKINIYEYEENKPLTKNGGLNKSVKNYSLRESLRTYIAHPFDDKDLTFGDLKKIIENGLGGKLNREDNVTEKLDGQNLMVS